MSQSPVTNKTLQGGTARAARLESAKRLLLSLLLGFLVSSAWWQSEPGVDYPFYSRWNDAAASGDIERLGADLPRSVCGVPFFHWQAGTGLMALAVRPTTQALACEDQTVRLAGFLCAGLFWWTCWSALRCLSDPSEAWLGCALGALATPLGYYSLSISSETASLLPLGVLFLHFCRGLRGQPTSPPAIAAAAALLIAIRSYLGIYAWPAMYVTLAQAAGQGRRHLAVTAATLATGIAVASLQLGIVNYWMTGSPIRSPYVFGDSQFSSLDGGSPHWHRVLFETYHGMFPAHPFMLLGLIGMVLLGTCAAGSRAVDAASWGTAPQRAGSRMPVSERAAWLVTSVAVVVHIYLQGCWYYWWLAEDSFAMRGLVAASVPAVLAFIRIRHSGTVLFPRCRWLSRVSQPWVTALVTAMSVWSWLLWQQGPMDYLEWSCLLEGQWFRLCMWLSPEPVALSIVSLILVGISWRAGWLGPMTWRTAPAVLLLAMIVAHLLERVAFRPPENLPRFYGVVAAVGGLICAGSWAVPRKMRGAVFVSSTLVGVLLVTSVLAFTNLWWHTRGRIVRRTEGYVTFHEGEALAAYKTLSQIPRFSAQRDTLRSFFARTFGEAWCRDVDRMIESGEEQRPVRSRGTRTRT